MGFTIRYDPRVAKSLIEKCRWFFDKVQKITPVPHKVGIFITDRITLSHDVKALKVMRKGSPFTLASFCPPASRKSLEKAGAWIEGCDCVILLSGKMHRFDKVAPVAKKTGLKYDRVDFFESALHEVSHYIQFRDKKKVQEKGIEERIDSLMRRLVKT